MRQGRKAMLDKFIADHWGVLAGTVAGSLWLGRLTNKTKNHCTRIVGLEESSKKSLTIAGHESYCTKGQEVINLKLDNLMRAIEKGEVDHTEIFGRLSEIEKSAASTKEYIEIQKLNRTKETD